MATRNKKTFSYFYRNGLTIVFLSLFILTLFAQIMSGWKVYNENLNDERSPSVTLSQYLRSGHFISATFENFESEFLQMGLYVILTVILRQQGSAESKSLTEKEEVDRTPMPHRDAPWAVKKGGLVLWLYSRSLSICFFILFFASWGLHFYGSWKEYNTEQILQEQMLVSKMDYLTKSKFWFETFQNWQSEFISICAIVFFTIYLRQKGSPQSKPVDAPDNETGS